MLFAEYSSIQALKFVTFVNRIESPSAVWQVFHRQNDALEFAIQQHKVILKPSLSLGYIEKSIKICLFNTTSEHGRSLKVKYELMDVNILH